MHQPGSKTRKYVLNLHSTGKYKYQWFSIFQ